LLKDDLRSVEDYARSNTLTLLCSVWHPLQGPLVDWPLAICDAETVDYENDTMVGDVVDRDAVFENTQVHYNPEQKWYYLANQIPSELLIFKNADSESKFGASPGKCTVSR
jgi:hypothetical protein